MREIRGDAKNIRGLLKGVKYSIDYYQREYKWKDKQVFELLDDLSNKFLEDYQQGHSREKVGEYGHYFLGSIIVSRKDSNYIVDGQQRLTSITLLLIYLRNLQEGRKDRVNVDELIFSEKFGKKSFNLDIKERLKCMDALFEKKTFDDSDQPESVQNIIARYHDIEEKFPEELSGEALPYFIDWLLENVHLVEITAYSDDDAYTIFETMNDRGLSLSPTDMLKGFLLANITEKSNRDAANKIWKEKIQGLIDHDKEADADCFKAWLRSQYASKIRERKRGAKPEDFDKIGTEFHRWIRDNKDKIGLKGNAQYFKFIDRDFKFYSRQYLRIMEASDDIVSRLEHIRYNADHGFTLQSMLLLAPLRPDDKEEIIIQKLRLVAMFVDILLTWRLWNSHSIAYSTMQYAMFLVMRDIRGLSPKPLAKRLYEQLNKEEENFMTNDRLSLHQQNRKYLHRILARITDYVVQESRGSSSVYKDLVSDSRKDRFEVEHIWADKPAQHKDEFSHPVDFEEYRNRIGGLLLLPKSFNASYGDLPYQKKLPHYDSQNLLVRTLHPNCYAHNSGFLGFKKRSGLPFQDHKDFKKADLDARGELYKKIAELIWDPNLLLGEVGL